MKFPFTSGDLRRLAKFLDEWERLLIDSKTGEYRPRAELISKVTVTRPDDAEVIGHFILEDGWVGFEFKGYAA